MTVSRRSIAALVVTLVASIAWSGAMTPTHVAAPTAAGTVRASALPIAFGPEVPADGELLGLLNPVTYVLVTYFDPNPAVVVGVDFHLDGMNLTSAGFFNNSAFTMPVGFAFRDGPHFANFTLVDSVGAIGYHNWTFTVDTIPPILSITSPAYPLVAASSVVVAGNAVAALPQAAPVTVSVTVFPSMASLQTLASTATGGFSVLVPLSEGANLLVVEATDAAKNPTTWSVGILSDTTPPIVTLASPPDGLETNVSTVSLRGTVNDVNATVLVNDEMIRPDGSGRWQTTVALLPGANTINVSAVDAAGNRATPLVLHVTYFSPIPDLQNGTAASQRSLDEQAAILRFSVVGIVLLLTGITLVLYSRMSQKIRDDRRVIAELVRAAEHKK